VSALYREASPKRLRSVAEGTKPLVRRGIAKHPVGTVGNLGTDYKFTGQRDDSYIKLLDWPLL